MGQAWGKVELVGGGWCSGGQTNGASSKAEAGPPESLMNINEQRRVKKLICLILLWVLR